MKHTIYKLSFTTPVHFGTGVLNESAISFCADTLFSALYIEALKLGCADELYETVQTGQLTLSDAFPYQGKCYYLPKLMLYIEPKDPGNSSLKKQYKKIKYIPAKEMHNYLSGVLEPAACDLQSLGQSYSQVMTFVRTGEDPLPYRVGNYFFRENCGLYILAAWEKESWKEMLENLLESLSYTGIGGKRGSGKGHFELKRGTPDDSISRMLTQESETYLLISSALPREEEMEAALDGASYLVQKRSGFIYSEHYAKEQRKKRELYTMQAGSCFRRPFHGSVYDVSEGGAHPVYRYAKGMFLGV